MDADLSIRFFDFTFGMLLMFQIMGTAALYLKGRHHQLQRSAFRFMLYLLGISLFEFFVVYIDNFLNEQTTVINDMLEMTVVPVALMLLYRLTHSRNMRPSLAIISTAPYVVALVAYAIHPLRVIYDVMLGVAVAHSIVIIAYGTVAVRQFNKRLVANFSSDDNLSLRWMRLFLLLYIAFAAVWYVATKSATDYVIALYNVMCSAILGLLCYFVYRQEDMLDLLRQASLDEDTATTGEELPSAGAPDGPARHHFDEALERVFREKQIYLNPTLNINELAQELGTNRTYVSNYINQQLHTTFYEYVNNWRVEQAMGLLTSTDLSLQEVAAQSGFNSISSFRRYFVSKMGQTPSAYKKAHKA